MKFTLPGAVSIFVLSAGALMADSSTPPTREGTTPGTDREARYEAQEAAVVRTAPKTVDADHPLHHRISQGMN